MSFPLPTTRSWTLRNILSCKDLILEWQEWANVATPKTFSIKEACVKLQGQLDKVPWKGLICNNGIHSKECVFCMAGGSSEALYM